MPSKIGLCCKIVELDLAGGKRQIKDKWRNFDWKDWIHIFSELLKVSGKQNFQ